MIRRKMFILAGLLAGASLLSACSGSNSFSPVLIVTGQDTKQPSSVQSIAQAQYPQEPVYKNDEERWEARSAKSVPEAFQNAYRTFIYETASELLKDRRENVAYSPIGLYYGLSAAAMGAEEGTKKELLDLLGYPEEEELAEDGRAAFEALYHVPNEKNRKKNEGGELPAEAAYTLRIANSLWADEALELKTEFAQRAAQYLYSDVYQAKLHDAKTAAAMAEWVKDRTNGLIVPEAEPVPEEVLLSLRNTVYFYDEWLDRFDRTATKEDVFTMADGTKVTCDFMNRRMGSHGFRRGENYTASSLPLKNGQMTFILPDEGTDVHELVRTPELLKEVLDGTSDQMMGEVVWKVPKFSYGCSLELAGMLEALGVQKAFSESEADFTAVSGQKPLYLSAVSQDVHIGIDENGVEAAAFTELSWAGAALPEGRADMILDRPFLYAVRNRGQLLFIGICENPAAMSAAMSAAE